jgi:hypothetical protein
MNGVDKVNISAVTTTHLSFSFETFSDPTTSRRSTIATVFVLK